MKLSMTKADLMDMRRLVLEQSRVCERSVKYMENHPNPRAEWTDHAKKKLAKWEGVKNRLDKAMAATKEANDGQAS